MQFFLYILIFAVLIKYIPPTFHSRCQPSYKISSKYLNPRLNYNNFFEIQDGGRLISWIFDILILSNTLFHHCTKFGAKMLIDSEIIAKNRNPRWRLSAILDLLHHNPRSLFVGPIALSNFMLIRCIVLKIWRFEFFLQICFKMPIHAPKILE